MTASLRFLNFRMRRRAKKSFATARPKLSDLPLGVIKAIEMEYKLIYPWRDDKSWIALCMDGAKEVTRKFPWLKPYEDRVGFLISIF